MSFLTVACCFAAVPLVALGLLGLQVRLEQWDQKRHAKD